MSKPSSLYLRWGLIAAVVIALLPAHAWAQSFQWSPEDTTATAGDFVEYTIYALDASSDPTPVTADRDVTLSASSGQFFLPSDHGTPITEITIPNGSDSVRVDYRATLANSDPFTLFAFTNDGLAPPLFGSTDVTIVAAVADANLSTISVSPGTAVADGLSSAAATTTARDAFGNTISGAAVVVISTSGDTNVPGSPPTGANGQSTIPLTSLVAESVTINAQVDGVSLNVGAPLTFVAGPVDGTVSTISADSSVVADGASTSTITVTARDTQGNPVPGQSVTLSVSPQNGSELLTQPGGVTGANGVATGTLSSTKTGQRIVGATIGATAIAAVDTVDFVPAPLASFAWVVDGAGVAGQIETVTLTALDSQGNVKTDYTGTVNLSTTSGGAGDVVEWGSPGAINEVTNGAGDAATYVFDAADAGEIELQVTNNLAETFQLIAVDGGANGTSGSIVIDHAVAANIDIVAGDGQTVTVNNDVPVPVRVRVTDAFDNAVDGQTVTFRVVAGGGTLDVVSGPGADSTTTTDTSGEAVCDVWTLGTTAGSNALQAQAASATVNVNATGTPDVGSNLLISPPSQPVTVGSVTPVIVTLRDAHNNVVPGERVDVFIQATANGTLTNEASAPTTQITPTARFGTTDANGQIMFNHNAVGTAGLSDNVDAFTSLVGAGSVADAVYTTTASGATNLRLSVQSSLPAAAGATITLLVEAVDGNGNVDPAETGTVNLTAEAGSGLQFSDTDFGSIITQIGLSSGQATFYAQGPSAGTWQVGVDGLLAADSVDVEIQSAGTVTSYAVVAPANVTAGQGFNVAIEARDAFDNLVTTANNSVTLVAVDAVTENPETVTLLTGNATLVNGVATVAESYTLAKTIKVEVSDGGVTDLSNDIAVAPAAAHRIEKIAGDGTIAAGAAQDLDVRVADSFDNDVPGVTVSFGVDSGSGVLSAPTAVTDANGESSVTLTTGTTVDSNTIRATINDGVPASLELVSFAVNTIAGAIDNYTVTPSTTTPIAGESVALTIRAYDANNNLVVQDNTTTIDISAGGDAQLAATNGTLSSGVFNTSVADTLAETFTVTVQTQGNGSVNGTSPSIVVSNGPPYRIVTVSGDTTGVTVGSSRSLVAEVRDEYDNTVAGTFVTFFITPSGGIDGTATITESSGNPNDGVVAADANGRAVATLNTALTAGNNTVAATILDGQPLALERVDYTVTTVADQIAYYDVSVDVTNQTVGQAVTVTVQAFDSSNNPVNDTGTQVALSLATGAGPIFGQNPLTLSAGTAQTTVTVNTAQAISVLAETQGNASVNGTSPTVTFVPDVPAGTITATPSPATITANGTSETTVTSAVITDAFGNTVAENTPITVDVNLGGVIASIDGDPAPGTQILTNASGVITFQVRSGTTAGAATVIMNSLSGTASGNTGVTFAPLPNLVSNTIPSPDVVALDSPVSFSVQVQNTSSTALTLNTGTMFEFTDGSVTYSAPLAAQQTISGSGSVLLAFSSTVVSASMTPGFYQPIIRVSGTDEFGAAFSQNSFLPAQSVLVTGIRIAGVIPQSTTVRHNDIDTVTVLVENQTPNEATINAVSLSIDTDGHYDIGDPVGPATIAGNTTRAFLFPVLIEETSPTGLDTLDASVDGTIMGQTVFDLSLAPEPVSTWEVIAAADLQYVSSTLSPTVVSRGTNKSFQLEIRNDGPTTVTLDTATTTFEFTDGGNTYSTTLSNSVAIAPSFSQVLTFKPKFIPTAFTQGDYAANLQLRGNDPSGPVVLDRTTSDLITVQAPANVVLAAANAVSPDVVSQNASVAFQVDVVNNGAATVELNPTTTFSFAGGQFSATLDGSATTTLPPGPTTLTFNAATISSGIAASSYSASVTLNGTENGQPVSFGPFTSPDQVTVQSPPEVQIVSISAVPGTITTNQSGVTVTMRVRNNGGTDVNFDSVGLTFTNAATNVDSQFDPSNPTGFAGGPTLSAGGSEDDIVFTVNDMPGAMTPGSVIIDGDLTVIDALTSDPINTNTGSGGAGVLNVQTPAALSVLAITPNRTQVTFGQAADVVVTAFVRNTGQADFTWSLGTTNLAIPSGNWTHGVPVSSLGGAIPGGDTDTLTFTYSTPGNAGQGLRIDLDANGTEDNTGAPVNANTAGGGALASISVQQPADIEIVTTMLRAPFAPLVNTGQSVGVQVQVTNNGEATVDNVTLGLLAASGSTITGPAPVFSSLASAQTLIDTFAVDMRPTPGSETFTSSIASATDRNSGESLYGVTITDNTATATVQAPAVIAVANANVSQTSITALQSVDWFVTVTVQNNGEADLVLNPPTGNDLAFSIGGLPQNDYAVIPPSTFEGGGAGWTIAGGDSENLRYIVTTSGANTGTLDIRATINARDGNNPFASLNDFADTPQVTVDAASGLFINTTITTLDFNEPNDEVSTVNVGQVVNIEVVVNNSGESADSVEVSLAQNGTSTITPLGLPSRPIGDGGSETYVFEVVAGGTGFETFTATITKAISSNTQNPINPSSSNDDTQSLFIQVPATISVAASVTDPPGATELSTNQSFTLSAQLARGGESALEDSGSVAISLPVGFTLDPGSPINRKYVAGETIDWLITAPANEQTNAPVAVRILDTPTDINIDDAAAIAVEFDTVFVNVSPAGDLSVPTLVITAPAGATDSTVSTGQQFTMVATINTAGNAQAVTSTLQVPSGFTLVGGAVQNLGDGPGQLMATYTVIAPATANGGQFEVVFEGTDANSGGQLVAQNFLRNVSVVNRAQLTLGVQISGPPEATDSTVTIGSTFTMQAIVNNGAGQAGIDPTSAPAVTLSLPTGYTLASGTATRTFSLGVPVTWDVVAPGQPSGPDGLSIDITGVPDDENSGNPAVVLVGSRTVPIVTQGAAVSALNTTEAQGIAPTVVPGGSRDVDMLAVEITYTASDVTASDARVDSIAVSVLDAAGRLVNNPSRTLAGLTLTASSGSATPLSLNSNPVWIRVSDVGSDAVIPPNMSSAFTVSLDLVENPQLDELALRIGGAGAIVVRDAVSGQRFGVVDSQTGQGLGNVSSPGLVILSNNFEEYAHNYPNPFRAGEQSTRIAYFLDQDSNVDLKIYSLTGKLVFEASFASGDPEGAAGAREILWDGRNAMGDVVRNGLYVCKLTAGSQSATFRIAVAK